MINPLTVPAGISIPEHRSQTLDLIAALLHTLHTNNINYCHWKSSEHLNASMTGATDLDILFDEKEKELVVQLVGDLGFKKFHPVKEKQYQDIEDYIGLDYAEGKMVHLHAHFKLTLGEAYLKSYQFKLESQILDTKVFDQEFGIYRIAPAFEMVLLFFRLSLKTRSRDLFQIFVKNRKSFAENILREYQWLKKRCSNAEIEQVLKVVAPHKWQPIYKLLTGVFNRISVWRLSFLVKAEFRDQRSFTPLQARFIRWYREAILYVFRKASKWQNWPIAAQRINPRGGLTVAVIGADGSGKSTIVANLQSTFRKKMDVYRVYLGKGRRNRVSFPRRLLLGLKRWIGKTKPATIVKSNELRRQNLEMKPVQTAKVSLYKCVQALLVATEKQSNIRRLRAARRKGMLVLADRFPQCQMPGFNDGPVLYTYARSHNPLMRYLSRWEHRIYAEAENHPPDIVFKLVADADTLRNRKPGFTPLEVVQKKVDGIRQLQFKEGCKVYVVDAALPLEEVLFTVRKTIWENIP